MRIVHLNPNPESSARLVGYLHDGETEKMTDRLVRPCVIICPGGGYSTLSAREAEPPATAFFAKGYNVFILYYSILNEACDLRPLADISLAIIMIRENASLWGVITNQIAVCGFSAGANVAASAGTLWDNPKLREKIDTKDGSNKPDAMILCYPLITAGEYTHRRSMEYIGAGLNENERVELFSLEKHVSASTPPAFLWHTVEDQSVPVENTMMFSQALQKFHVPFECHIYQKGYHGLSMCNAEVNSKNSHCATWFELCVEWLGDLFDFDY